MLGAYVICTGTSGNGAATGTVNIPRVQSVIPGAQKRARAAWSVAAVGPTRQRIVGRRTDTGSTRRDTVTSSAFVLP